MPPTRDIPKGRRPSERQILRHCYALERGDPRRPARTRLDEALGPALAQRLVSSLSLTGRPPRP